MGYNIAGVPDPCDGTVPVSIIVTQMCDDNHDADEDVQVYFLSVR